MFTSDEAKRIQINIVRQLLFALFCALFGAIYEIFSHEVYSYFMIYAFAIPLVFAVLPLSVCLLKGRRTPDPTARLLWNFGTVTLTVGCIFRGILEIYGTTNRLLWGYRIAAAILFIGALISQRRAGKKEADAASASFKEYMDHAGF